MGSFPETYIDPNYLYIAHNFDTPILCLLYDLLTFAFTLHRLNAKERLHAVYATMGIPHLEVTFSSAVLFFTRSCKILHFKGWRWRNCL